MILVSKSGNDYIEVLKDLIEDGNIMIELSDGTRYLIDREETNNKYATMQNCRDGAINTFHIESETEELFGDADCFTDISMTINVK